MSHNTCGGHSEPHDVNVWPLNTTDEITEIPHKESPLPKTNTVCEIVNQIVDNEFEPFCDGDIWVDTIYVVGSRGCPTGNVTDSSDLDLAIIIGGDKSLSKFDIEQAVNRLSRDILWEHHKEVIKASDLDDIDQTVYAVDFLVFPKHDEQHELNKHMEHGGYQNVYSVTDSEYLY